MLHSRFELWQVPRTALLVFAALLAFFALHSPVFAQADFNHDRTGYHLDGAHQNARCLSCHGQGVLRGTPKACNQCHILGNRTGTTMVQGPSHVPGLVGAACDACHISQASFRIWRMDHTQTTMPCSSCHSGQSFEGVVPVTKTARHPVTTSDCSFCHTSTTTFTLVSRFDHIGVAPGTCINCHGSTAMGQPIGHMPVPANVSCDVCHQSTVTFTVWTMANNGHGASNIFPGSGNCSLCHGGQSFFGVTPTTKPGGHIATAAQCDTCHTSTLTPGGFALTNRVNPHPGGATSTTCQQSGCHDGLSATGQIAGHIPTTVGPQCGQCHSDRAANFGVGLPNIMNHAAVNTANCSTCHGAGRSFPGVTMVTQPSGHIPTSADCSSCHTNTTVTGGFATYSMNHTGIATGCVNCHGTSASFLASVPPLVKMPASGHILTSLPCENCHSPSRTSVGNFRTFGTMSHTGIVSGCNLCHDTGVSFSLMQQALVTKPAGTHIPTSGPCEWCHASTTIPNGFKTQSMSHTGIASGCNQCHTDKGVPALYPAGSQGPIVGQPASHISTTGQDCAACHTSTQIPGGFRLSVSSFDHVKAGVQPGTCTNCHNGATATGPITGHIPINVGGSCDTCHAYGVGGFTKWTMKHTGTRNPTNCTACHGAAAPSIPGATMVTFTSKGTHFPIGANQCGACHTAPASVASPGGGTGFATWTMSHASVSATACSVCHLTGASWVGAVPVVTYPANHIPVTGGTNSACNDCHTASDTPGSGGFKTFSTNLHASSSVSGLTCKTCHLVNSFLASSPPLVTLPGSGHIPLTAGTLSSSDCKDCHTSTTITGGFQTWSMPSAHFGINSNCVSCHSGTFPGVLGKIAGHLQTTANCESCHTSTTVPGGFATTTRGNPHQVTPVYTATTTCQTAGCHDGIAAMGQTASHIPTTAGALCGRCHSPTAASFAVGLPGIMNHAYANTASCGTCHAPGKNFPGVTMVFQPATHITTLGSADCSVCHSNTTITGGFTNRSMNHSGVNAGSCNGCHTGQVFATGVTPKLMTAPVGSPGGHITINGGTDCVLCHTTTTVPGGFASRNMNHSGVNTATCVNCHAAAPPGVTFATGVTPKFMPAQGAGGHIAITGGTDCKVCHSSTSTGGFAIRNMTHSAVNTATCGACHSAAPGITFATGVIPKPKPTTGHISTNSDCSSCHTATNIGGFAIFSMNHAAITALQPCGACHSAASAATLMASSPAIVTPPASHSSAPYAGNECSNSGCHLSTNTGPGGFALAGKVHTVADAGKCNTCHGAGGTATKKQSLVGGAGHIPTGAAQCDQCHNYPPSAPNFGTWTMRHAAVSGTPCSTCHSAGQTARTGPNGSVTIVGYPASGHITLLGSATCNLCHTSRDLSAVLGTGFSGQGSGWTMNHAGVNNATCTTCHTQGPAGAAFATGVVPVFKPANHVPFTPSSLDCKTCHSSTTSFKVGSMSHAGIINGCQNCHGNAPPGIAFANVTPTFKPVNHIATTGLDCSGCHVNTATFTVRTMNHSFVNATTCNGCHNNQTFATGVVPKAKGANHITTSIDCVTCHTGFTTFAGGRMGTTEHVANGNTATCTGCHSGQAFQGVTPVAKPGNHIVTSGDCVLCHSTSNFSVGAFGTLWGMNHTGITLNCIQCHNGTSFGTSAPLVPVSKVDTPSPGHVPTNADCSNCHNIVNTAVGGGKVPSVWATIKKPQVHTAVLLTGYSAGAACYPCHGLTTPTYLGVLNQCGTNKGLQAGDHKKCTATNCASCHKGNETGGKFK